MTPSDFTQHPEVVKLLSDLRAHFAGKEAVFSDIVDGHGHQYVDLVQEGGGVWGVALLGYTWTLEEMGIRFASMGGTSAGAINTLLLAAAAQPSEKRTDKILPHLANKNLFDFVDGPALSRMMVNALVRGESRLLLAMRAAMCYPRMRRKLGLNPGQNFESWLAETIAGFGVATLRDLETRMNDFPADIRHRSKGELDSGSAQAGLAFIAAEIETGTKVRLPHHAQLFFRDYRELNPARYVRASMSIPIFFEPMVLRREAMPKSSREEWDRLLGHSEGPPHRAVLVDGGILSNFPIDVFHQRERIPTRPTLGVKLMTGNAQRANPGKPPKPLRLMSFLGGNFSAARHLRDQEFIFSNPDYRHLVAQIDVGDHNWINFGISDEGKIDLFLRGVQAAHKFLLGFNWERYKLVRASLIAEAIQESHEGLASASGKAAVLLRAALEGRNLPTEGPQQTVLLDRFKGYEMASPSFRILWVDDFAGQNKKEKELISALSPGLSITEVLSSQAAEEFLEEEEFQLMISDIRRGDNPNEGVELLDRLLAKGLRLPVIFFIDDFDPKRGIPAGAFGITNSPADLLHLVMDAMARSGIGQQNMGKAL